MSSLTPTSVLQTHWPDISSAGLVSALPMVSARTEMVGDSHTKRAQEEMNLLENKFVDHIFFCRDIIFEIV